MNMELLAFLSSLFLLNISCELVVNPEEEKNLSSEYLLSHAEVIHSYQQEGRCPEVQDEVRILRYYVQQEGGPGETRQERNVGALVVSPGHIVEHNYSWSEESWLPRRQRIK